MIISNGYQCARMCRRPVQLPTVPAAGVVPGKQCQATPWPLPRCLVRLRRCAGVPLSNVCHQCRGPWALSITPPRTTKINACFALRQSTASRATHACRRTTQ